MSTLITGGLGFVGRYVVDELVEQGERVISLNRDFAADDRELVTCVQAELFDIPALVRILHAHDVDKVVHTAGMSHPEISIELPLTTFAANVDGTLKLLEAMRMAKVARLVNFSSECAYGDQPEDRPVVESATPQPNTPYGVTKVTTEHLGRVYSQLYGMEVVSLRVTEVYGPRLRMPEVLKEMLRAAIDGVPFELSHGADHKFHFVHARDVAHAAVLASTCARLTQPVYNVAGDRQVTLREAADLIRARFPQAELKLGDGPIPNWDRQGPFDITAAERDLGYHPSWVLERGLDDYATWLRSNDA